MLVEILRASREVVFYGLIHVASGFSTLVYGRMVSETLRLYSGLVSMALGLVIFAVSLLWRWGPWPRPLGITLLGISFSLAGLVTVILGGWLFTPLFALALVFFLVAWGLFSGKSWTRTVVYVIVGISLLMSLIGVVDLVPGVLGSMYLLWYLNRPHVAEYFKGSFWRIDVQQHKKGLIFTTVVLLLLTLPLTYLYINPLSYTALSGTTSGSSSGPGAGGGSHFFARRGDLVTYSFQVVENSPPIHFWIEFSESPQVTIASTFGYEGSGTAEVPYTGDWIAWVESTGTYMSAQREVQVTLYSARVSIVQGFLLDFYIVAMLLWLTLTSKLFYLKQLSSQQPTQQ